MSWAVSTERRVPSLLPHFSSVTNKPEPNAFTKCGRDSPRQWLSLFPFGLVWLLLRFVSMCPSEVVNADMTRKCP